MAIQFPCKSCGQTLSVAEEHAGKQARCPSCMTVQPVPGPSGSSGSQSSLGTPGSSGSTGGYTPPTISFGGSVFDPPTQNNSASPTGPAPSSGPAPASSDSIFGTPETKSSSSGAPGSSGSQGGGLFDGLGVEKLEPIESPTSGNRGASEGIFGAASTPSSTSASSSSGKEDNYYLEAPGGAVYGPVDWRTLVAWKNQGRVGPGYRIRKGENGAWQVASSTDLYATTANPFADTVPSMSQSSTPQYQYQYSQQDRSGLILALGILAWVLTFSCGPFGTILGVLAWIFGAQDLRAAREGRVDPRTLTSIQVGYYLGMIQVLLSVLCFGGYLIMIIVAIASEQIR